MRTITSRAACTAAGLTVLLPGAAAAHPGHMGDHGWLAGALQPLASLDHLAAAVFVVLGLSGAGWLVRRARRTLGAALLR